MYTGSLDTFSNREDWKARFRVIDGGPDGSGEDVDLTGCTVTLGVYENKCQRFTGSTTDGIITLSEYTTGVFSIIEWTVPETTTKGFCAGSYDIGITISNDDQTMQLVVGTVAVVDGNVP